MEPFSLTISQRDLKREGQVAGASGWGIMATPSSIATTGSVGSFASTIRSVSHRSAVAATKAELWPNDAMSKLVQWRSLYLEMRVWQWTPPAAADGKQQSKSDMRFATTAGVSEVSLLVAIEGMAL
jgi:hypothetical protein